MIRLARNPGDQIIRNLLRCWDQNTKLKNKYGVRNIAKSCKTNVTDACIKAIKRSQNYVSFHSFWNDFDRQIPQTVFYYEEFSDHNQVAKATVKMMQFLNVTQRKHGDIAKQLEGIINDIDYAHGTLMANVCGKDAARRLDEETKEVSQRLGYAFDYDSATWSLERHI